MKMKKKNYEMYIKTQLSLTMFKPVSTFTYSEKKINLNLHLISKAQCSKEN